MQDEGGRNEDDKIVEIERLIEGFKRKFKEGTSNADAFMTMTEMELMWGELQDKTNKIYSDILREMMREVDERDLIRKKKGVQRPRHNAQNAFTKSPVGTNVQGKA